jgi:sugar-specific transcriptional regulator TrmB
MLSRTDTPARARRNTRLNSAKQDTASNVNECPREIPASTPHYNSFGHIRDPKLRRAKEYEQHLLILKDMFPQYGAGIDEQIAYAKSQQDRNHVSDRDRVIKQLESCPLTCAEVAEDLNMPHATAYKILRAFAECGLVIIAHRPRRDGKKPLCVYSLSHSRSL